eukprot:gene9327-6682_t
MRGGSIGLNSRISQLFICMTTIAFAIVVLIFTRQDILSAEHASKLAPPQHLRSYLDSFSSTLNNVSAVTGAAFDNFIASSTNSFAAAMAANDNVVFSNATALPDAPLVASFANRLFPHHAPDNLFSPVSLLYALSFLRLGAVDGAAAAPASLLSMERLSQFFAHFSVATNADAHMVQLLCVNDAYPVKGDFQRSYGHFLPLLAGNFSHKPAVNEKIRRHFLPATQNDVNPLAKGIRAEAVAILYDTFYFRAIWAEPFLETQTRYVDFVPSNRKTRNIRALHRVFRRLPYLETEQFQLIEIPFDPRRYVFGVFLPKTAAAFNVKYDTDFAALQERWIPQLTMTAAVAVTVPKLRQRQWLRLGATMKKLASAVPEYRAAWEAQGLSQIVDVDATTTTGGGGLNEVIHEVPFTVWEAGANIAENTATQTATVSVSTAQGSLEDASAAVRFTADRQFVYYVRDRVTNVLLLVGDFDA